MTASFNFFAELLQSKSIEQGNVELVTDSARMPTEDLLCDLHDSGMFSSSSSLLEMSADENLNADSEHTQTESTDEGAQQAARDNDHIEAAAGIESSDNADACRRDSFTNMGMGSPVLPRRKTASIHATAVTPSTDRTSTPPPPPPPLPMLSPRRPMQHIRKQQEHNKSNLQRIMSMSTPAAHPLLTGANPRSLALGIPHTFNDTEACSRQTLSDILDDALAIIESPGSSQSSFEPQLSSSLLASPSSLARQPRGILKKQSSIQQSQQQRQRAQRRRLQSAQFEEYCQKLKLAF